MRPFEAISDDGLRDLRSKRNFRMCDELEEIRPGIGGGCRILREEQ